MPEESSAQASPQPNETAQVPPPSTMVVPALQPAQAPMFDTQQARLAQVEQELHTLFQPRVDRGDLWGVVVVVAVDHMVQKEFTFFPNPAAPGLPPEEVEVRTKIKRQGLYTIGAALRRVLELIRNFVSSDLGFPRDR